MYLREPQFHLKNSKLAEVFNTIFNDLIVGRQDVETLETELYSYDIYVKNTILTVFIFRAEIVSLLGEKDVEVLGFCYPRELEQKIIDVSVNKNYQTVFKVPNGIKDLETVEVRNLRLQSPGFSELYSRFFINPHYYILNAYPVHCDPKLISDISTECGFEDSNYFSVVFTRETGMTPSQWRHLNSQKD